jgi:hypothetical protein
VIAESIVEVYPGKRVSISVVFTGTDGADVDPAVVTIEWTLPDKTSTTYEYLVDGEVIRDSEGHYHADFTLDALGRHKFVWSGTDVGVDPVYISVTSVPDWPGRALGGPH